VSNEKHDKGSAKNENVRQDRSDKLSSRTPQSRESCGGGGEEHWSEGHSEQPKESTYAERMQRERRTRQHDQGRTEYTGQ